MISKTKVEAGQGVGAGAPEVTKSEVRAVQNIVKHGPHSSLLSLSHSKRVVRSYTVIENNFT